MTVDSDKRWLNQSQRRDVIWALSGRRSRLTHSKLVLCDRLQAMQSSTRHLCASDPDNYSTCNTRVTPLLLPPAIYTAQYQKSFSDSHGLSRACASSLMKCACSKVQIISSRIAMKVKWRIMRSYIESLQVGEWSLASVLTSGSSVTHYLRSWHDDASNCTSYWVPVSRFASRQEAS